MVMRYGSASYGPADPRSSVRPRGSGYQLHAAKPSTYRISPTGAGANGSPHAVMQGAYSALPQEVNYGSRRDGFSDFYRWPSPGGFERVGSSRNRATSEPEFYDYSPARSTSPTSDDILQELVAIRQQQSELESVSPRDFEPDVELEHQLILREKELLENWAFELREKERNLHRRMTNSRSSSRMSERARSRSNSARLQGDPYSGGYDTQGEPSEGEYFDGHSEGEEKAVGDYAPRRPASSAPTWHGRAVRSLSRPLDRRSSSRGLEPGRQRRLLGDIESERLRQEQLESEILEERRRQESLAEALRSRERQQRRLQQQRQRAELRAEFTTSAGQGYSRSRPSNEIDSYSYSQFRRPR
eukprot:NODE_1666_length_1451_cov_61.547076_g1505_i0.p1 GENE.NODE_1666_length_1451_cov_61.547076_g1505_i0~~NODE_1666_length_1451_cov_61.547076_g1505_i0.p1  ORF type:complete len:358 (+),score=55.47 NODE_1666_length_1451_cov_61.547076_g1505_i0:216-1289(+)